MPDRDPPDANEPVAPVLGTDVLGRPFNDAEKRRFETLLRKHGWPKVRRRALAFGLRMARSREGAEDLVGRASLRLVRRGWNPNEVSLVARMLRLVWSEWTHEVEADQVRLGAEEKFVAMARAAGEDVGKSAEQYALRADEERREDERAQRKLERLREAFVKAKDNVNLFWLSCTVEGVADLGEMARRSGREVSEFYDAAKRRKRVVARLLAEERGVTHDDEESPR